jgi:hypothetical protein
MRQEYSAALDSYRHLLPTRLATRLRLELLSRREALKAICNPARAAGVDFAGDAEHRLLDELGTVHEHTGDGGLIERRVPFVEPLHLQIVCHRLWDLLPEDARAITAEHLRLDGERGGMGEVEEALEEYYASVVAQVAAHTGAKERHIRDWLEQELITPQGLRRQVLQGEQETAGLANGVVKVLELGSLLRSDARGGALWYEVTHDRLAAVILQGNARWFEQHLQPFQIRAGIWSRMCRAGAEQSAAGEVITGADLRHAEQWARSHADEGTGVDREYLRYCRVEWNHRRHTRWLLTDTGLLMAGMILTFAIVVSIRNADIVRASERSRAYSLISASASEKWRSYNDELASLLAIQAYRVALQHGQERGLGARVEAVLRAALQSQPFAYSMSLPQMAETTGDSAILLSSQLGPSSPCDLIKSMG